MLINNGVAELFQQLEDWHKRKVEQLNIILDNKDKDIRIADIDIIAGSDMEKGLRIGLMLSLEFLGKLPFNIEKGVETMEECEICNGSGICAMCAGTGIDEEVNHDNKRCTCCFGSGECPECNGTGEVDAE